MVFTKIINMYSFKWRSKCAFQASNVNPTQFSREQPHATTQARMWSVVSDRTYSLIQRSKIFAQALLSFENKHVSVNLIMFK